jgi:hypothetical protein
MIELRAFRTATPQFDGRVLVVGGHGGSTMDTAASAELFDPAAVAR